MPGLILKLKAHERFMVNGVVVQNGGRNARLTVETPGARILRQRDAVHPQDVDTPVKRLCYIAQLVVAGELDEDTAAERLAHGLDELQRILGGIEEAAALNAPLTDLREGNFYAVLRTLRRLLPFEADLLRDHAAAEQTDCAAG